VCEGYIFAYHREGKNIIFFEVGGGDGCKVFGPIFRHTPVYDRCI
jgi:hypothetical protein